MSALEINPVIPGMGGEMKREPKKDGGAGEVLNLRLRAVSSTPFCQLNYSPKNYDCNCERYLCIYHLVRKPAK